MFLFRLGLLIPLCWLCPTSKMFFYLSLMTYLWTLLNHVHLWKLSWAGLETCSRITALWAAQWGLPCKLASSSWLVFSITYVILLTGWVLQAPIGGKIIVLSSTLPSVGPGSLKNREDPKILGTSKVSFVLYLLLNLVINGFRNLDYSKRRHLSTRLLPSSAQERRSQWTCSSSVLLTKTSLHLVITHPWNVLLGWHNFFSACLPHYTSGQTYYYPAFNAGRSEDAVKFAHEFGEVLATPIMLEAVMRVRASRGKILNVSSLSIADNFNYRPSYGLFPWQFLCSVNGPFGNARGAPRSILRHWSTDRGGYHHCLRRFPNRRITHYMLRSVFSSFSWKMIFMTKIGERRIRVITLALPTTTNLSEVFASADQVAIATFLANKAVERSLTNKLEDSRDYVFQKLVELLVSYKTSMTSSGAGASAQLAISDNLKMLPVLVLGLLKNVSFVMRGLVSTLANSFSGWNSTKCTDPSWYPGLLSGSPDVSAFTSFNALHLSNVLFIA